jgi:CRP/FNR family transcriptional regulator
VLAFAAPVNSILFSGLTPQAIEQVSQVMRPAPYARGDILFHAGEEALHLFIVYEGVVKKVYENAQGDEQILGFYQAGDIFGDLFLGKYPLRIATAIAVTDCVVATFSKADLERLIERFPRLAINFIQHQADAQRETFARMHAMRQVNARTRLLGTMVTLARRYCCIADGWFRLPPGITQSDVANIAGLNRSTASLLINELRREGVLGGEGRVLTVNRALVETILADLGFEILE